MVKTPEESDKLIYAETKFAMFVAELAMDPERTRIFVFFFGSGYSFIRICGSEFVFGSAPPNNSGKKSAIYTAKTLLSLPQFFFGLHLNFGRKTPQF